MLTMSLFGIFYVPRGTVQISPFFSDKPHMIRLFCAVLFAFCLAGCLKKPKHPQPETLDPIYQDLSSKKGKIESLLKMAKKTIEGTRRDWQEAEPQKGKTAVARTRYFQEEKTIKKLEQEILYYEFRMMSRKIAVRKEYDRAHANNLPWPDPKMTETYLAREKLRLASKAWDDRLPKLDQRIEQYRDELKSKLAAQTAATTEESAPAE